MKPFFLAVLSQAVLLFGQGTGQVPDLKLKLINGKQIQLSKVLKHGPVLIDFWATWCAPCKKEMVYLNKFQRTYGDSGFTVISINQDSQKSLSKVRSYIRSKAYTFQVAIDPNQQVAKILNAVVLPTTILIGSDRNIIWQHQGYLPGDEIKLEHQIRASLKLSD
ncbi:MAG: TlpA family protein disulfide reductase [Fidelibacterota bacterium]